MKSEVRECDYACHVTGSDLAPSRRHIALTLKYLVDNGTRPTVKELVASTGLAPSTVWDGLDDLERAGLVVALRSRGGRASIYLPTRPPDHREVFETRLRAALADFDPHAVDSVVTEFFDHEPELRLSDAIQWCATVAKNFEAETRTRRQIASQRLAYPFTMVFRDEGPHARMKVATEPPRVWEGNLRCGDTASIDRKGNLHFKKVENHRWTRVSFKDNVAIYEREDR